jgi:hypothetical protein
MQGGKNAMKYHAEATAVDLITEGRVKVKKYHAKGVWGLYCPCSLRSSLTAGSVLQGEGVPPIAFEHKWSKFCKNVALRAFTSSITRVLSFFRISF